MDRNMLIFLAASVVILVAYSQFAAPQKKKGAPAWAVTASAAGATAAAGGQAATGNAAVPGGVAAAREAPAGATPAAVKLAKPTPLPSDVVLENADLIVTLTTAGAKVTSVKLKRYLEEKRPVELLHLWPGAGALEVRLENTALAGELNTAVYQALPGDDKRAVTFRYRSETGLTVEKAFRLKESGYLWDADVAFQAGDAGFLDSGGVRFAVGSELAGDSKAAGENLEVITYADKRVAFGPPSPGLMSCVSREPAKDSGGALRGEKKEILWTGLKTKYFSFVLLPGFPAPQVDFQQIVSREGLSDSRGHPSSRAIVELETKGPMRLEAKTRVSYALGIYTGPVDVDRMGQLGSSLDKVIDLGFFTAIGRGMLWILKTLHRVTSNWGLSIVLLTLLVRGILWFPSQKSMVAMRGMAKIQPHLKSLQEKYKGDPKKLQVEMAKLYREHGISPLLPVLGCLPLLMQMPIFIALYATLASAIE